MTPRQNRKDKNCADDQNTAPRERANSNMIITIIRAKGQGVSVWLPDGTAGQGRFWRKNVILITSGRDLDHSQNLLEPLLWRSHFSGAYLK